ncbi:CAAX protease [Clostridium acetobutylicum]|nr:CAAX protease [Clostridium acetobutylicum]
MDKKLSFHQRYSKLRSGYKIAICFLLIMITIIIFEILTHGYKRNYGGQYPQEVAFILIPIILWKYVEKKTLQSMGFTKEKGSILSFVLGLVFGAVSMTAVFILLLATRNAVFLGNIMNPNITNETLKDLILFILVGFAEEIFLRGYCLRSISERNKKITAAIITSLLFSVLHALNPNVTAVFFVNVVLIGMLFSYMTFKFNIWLPIGFHIMWDYFEGNVWGFPDSGMIVKGIYNIKILGSNVINGGLVGPEGGLIVTFITLVGFLIIFLSKNNKAA